MYAFGLIGGLGFIFIQLVLYVDFAFCTNEFLVERMESADDDRDQKCWFGLLITMTLAVYAGCAVMIGFFFYYYTG